jgi:putative restriction endonuclease
MDELIRLAAFEWLKKQTEIYGETLQRSILTEGFLSSGQRIRLMGPQGIWKPKSMDLPLSITTVMDGPPVLCERHPKLV